MRGVELFQLALGIEWPWRVERAEFDPKRKRLDIHIDVEPAGTFACPECGRTGCKAWDTSEKEWRHLNFFQHEAFLHVRTPRVKWPEHGVRYFWATHSRLAPIVRVARTLEKHGDGVLRWFRSRVSNGILEGINRLIQAAKAKARGYRSTRNLIAMVYLLAGKLDLKPLPI